MLNKLRVLNWRHKARVAVAKRLHYPLKRTLYQRIGANFLPVLTLHQPHHFDYNVKRIVRLRHSPNR